MIIINFCINLGSCQIVPLPSINVPQAFSIVEIHTLGLLFLIMTYNINDNEKFFTLDRNCGKSN
jgi:hypothetical protein